MSKARRWIIGLTLATASLVGVVAHATNYSLWVNGRGGGGQVCWNIKWVNIAGGAGGGSELADCGRPWRPTRNDAGRPARGPAHSSGPPAGPRLLGCAGGGASGFGRVDCIPGHNAERAG